MVEIKKQNKNTLFEIICSNSGKPFAYKHYVNNDIIRTTYKPKINKYTEIKQSHSFCDPCLINEYLKVGLLYKLT